MYSYGGKNNKCIGSSPNTDKLIIEIAFMYELIDMLLDGLKPNVEIGKVGNMQEQIILNSKDTFKRVIKKINKAIGEK